MRGAILVAIKETLLSPERAAGSILRLILYPETEDFAPAQSQFSIKRTIAPSSSSMP
jgi:hypothetical protein